MVNKIRPSGFLWFGLQDSALKTHLLLCMFFGVIFALSFLFLPIVTEKDKKRVLTQKQMISTSQWRLEHLFAGRNTQLTMFRCQILLNLWKCFKFQAAIFNQFFGSYEGPPFDLVKKYEDGVTLFLKWQPCHFPVMAFCFAALIYLNVLQ